MEPAYARRCAGYQENHRILRWRCLHKHGTGGARNSFPGLDRARRNTFPSGGRWPKYVNANNARFLIVFVPRERAKFFPIDERKYCQTKDINVAQTPTPIINPIFFGFRQWSICRAREIGKYRSSLFVATE